MKKKAIVLFVLMLVLQISIIIHYAKVKPNFFIDEIWSFTKSNSYTSYAFDNEDPTPYFNRWLPPSIWHNAMTVQPEEEFSFDSVYAAHAKEINPFLHSFVLHGVCSFFPDQISKWFGIVPNIIFFSMGQIVLFLLSRKLFKKDILALLPCLLYGLSWGAINTVIFIRSYMMLIFFTLLNLYGQVCFFEQYTLKKDKNYYFPFFLMFTATVMGVLSHYHYLIFAFFISAGIFIYLCYKKDWKLAGKYSATMATAVLLSFAIFPKALQVVKGGKVIKIATLKDCFSVLSHDLFGEELLFFCLFFLIVFLGKLFFVFFNLDISYNDSKFFIEINNYKAFQNNGSLFFSVDEFFIFWPVLAGSLLLTFLVVSKTVPFCENRYFYNQYPIIMILLTGITYSLFSNMKCGKKILIGGLAVLLLCNISMYRRENIKFYNLNEIRVQKITDEVGKIPAFAIAKANCKDWYPLPSQFIIFSKCSETYLIEDKSISRIVATISGKKSLHGMMLFIAGNSNINKSLLFGKIKKEAKISTIEVISDNLDGQLYWIKR